MKRIFVLLMLAIVCIITAATASPYMVLYRAKKSLDQGDYATVVNLLDYERLRPNIKTTLHNRLDQTTSHNSVLIGLSALFPEGAEKLKQQAKNLIDSSVDNLINQPAINTALQEGLTDEVRHFIAAWALASDYVDYQKLASDMLTTGDIQQAIQAQERIVRKKVMKTHSNIQTTLKYCGLSCFNVQGQFMAVPINVKLERRGLFGWQVVEVALP